MFLYLVENNKLIKIDEILTDKDENSLLSFKESKLKLEILPYQILKFIT